PQPVGSGGAGRCRSDVRTDRGTRDRGGRHLRARPLRRNPMTVHFIGAGPGAADLITVRGRDILARSPVCLYAGSIMPREILDYCPPDARIVDTGSLSLDDIEAEYLAAHREG